MQTTSVKLELKLLIGLYLIILQRFPNKILSKQILNEVPTELQYVERNVLMKEVKTQNLLTFQLGTQQGINIAIRIIIGFQQRDRQGSRSLNNDTFYRPPVTSAQCIIGTKKYPESGFLLN